MEIDSYLNMEDMNMSTIFPTTAGAPDFSKRQPIIYCVWSVSSIHCHRWILWEHFRHPGGDVQSTAPDGHEHFRGEFEHR